MNTRVAAFVTVGAAGFVVQLFVLYYLAACRHWPYTVAAAVAVEAAVLNNFVWHERWTWRDRAVVGRRLPWRMLRYHCGTGIVSVCGNVLGMLLLIEWLHMPVLAANLAAVVLTSVANFVVADRWVFDRAAGFTSGKGRQAPGERTSTLADCRPARIHAARDGAPAVSP